MAKCDYCGTRILFGGAHAHGYRFCNEDCRHSGYSLVAFNEIPEEYLREQIRLIHQGSCPRCHGRGPIDVHTSYRIWSAFVLTSWQSRPHICCRKCGKNQQVKDGIFSLLFGWWGFPWGLIMTPVQILRNLFKIADWSEGGQPSKDLCRLIMINIGSRILESRK